jgi:ComF family protein
MSNQPSPWAIRLLNFQAAFLGQDCALCGERSGGRMICEHCDVALPRIARACASCALPLVSSALLCGACLRRRRHSFDDAVAAFEYRFPIDRWVQRFKYAGDLAIGGWLGRSLAQAVSGAQPPALLVAPPLTGARLRERGFNQAVELAKTVARNHGIACEPRAFSKVLDTSPQPGLGRRDRMRNLRDAFRCELSLAGEHVAIVDDVITTGATADSLARLLRQAGAGRVSAWAVARTPEPALR